MTYDKKTLRRMYDRTSGYCHLCGKKLAFTNYGRFGAKSAWSVDHSVALARGGADDLRNMRPACMSCNSSKGVVSSRTARGWNGRTRAPLSREVRARVKRSNAFGGGLLGGIVGAVGGPVGIAAGIAVGATIGYNLDPDGH